MRKTTVAISISAILAGCSTGVKLDIDKEFLVKCQTPAKLSGLTGEGVLMWAKENGPKITECIRIHNGLVTILEVSSK